VRTLMAFEGHWFFLDLAPLICAWLAIAPLRGWGSRRDKRIPKRDRFGPTGIAYRLPTSKNKAQQPRRLPSFVLWMPCDRRLFLTYE